MIKTFIKKLALTFSLATLLMVPAMATVHAAEADINQSLCNGANLEVGTTSSCATDGAAAEDKVNNMIGLVINIFSVIVGVVSVIMIIVGGLKYITSGGDSGNITSAKNTILYAIIGLVVVALAQVVVKFVLSKATSTT